MRLRIMMAAVLAFWSSGALADDDLIRVQTGKTVAEAMDALEAAVNKAGATVFARVDHAGGARGAGMELGDAQLLIFGNPKLGTPVMQADPLAGLFLPLKVLAYADADGQVWLVYHDPAEMFDDLEVDDDAPVIAKMQGALNKLTSAAAQ